MDAHYLIIFLIVAVIVGVVMLAGKVRQRKKLDRGDPNSLTGVSGWLALLVAGLLVIAPLLLVGQTVGAIEGSKRTYPTLLHLPQWRAYRGSMWGIVVLCIALSIWAGWGLVKGDSVGHVRRAQLVLWIIGPAKSVALILILPVVIFGRSSVDTKALMSLIQSTMVATIWTFYLQLSKRVKVTYPLGR